MQVALRRFVKRHHVLLFALLVKIAQWHPRNQLVLIMGYNSLKGRLWRAIDSSGCVVPLRDRYY